MSDLVALLTAVEANFDDRLARGVLADWLDDGDSRGPLLRAAEGAVEACEARDALDRALRAFPAEPVLEIEDATDDPDGSIAQRNWESEVDYTARWDRHWRERNELRDAYSAAYHMANDRLTVCSEAWFRHVRTDLVSRGFDVETFCGFVDTLHARASLLRRVRPGTVVTEPIRALYVAVSGAEDDRGAPTNYVALPHLATLAITYGMRPSRRGSLPGPRAADDLGFLLGSPWLARARTLVLAGEGPSARAALLAWASDAIPSARAERLPVLRLADRGATGWDEVRVFCESPLVAHSDEVDLGALLQNMHAEELDTVLSLPFPGVRVLHATCLFDNEEIHERGFQTVEESRAAAVGAFREHLGDAPVRWASEGREIRVRVAPLRPAVPSAERALRAYWTAGEVSSYDEEDYDVYEPDPESDEPDPSVTPSRRELYRGRFRNPRR